jgi:hypothetical protein
MSPDAKSPSFSDRLCVVIRRVQSIESARARTGDGVDTRRERKRASSDRIAFTDHLSTGRRARRGDRRSSR